MAIKTNLNLCDYKSFIIFTITISKGEQNNKWYKIFSHLDYVYYSYCADIINLISIKEMC